MRTQVLRLPRVLALPPLSEAERQLFCDYIERRKPDPSIRERMQREIELQSSEYIKLGLPIGRAAEERRKTWLMFIKGPIGGWEKKGRRVRRKWDPAARRASLRFTVLVDFTGSRKTTLMYEGDLFEWWILRALATRQIRNFFECWYCGKISCKERSTARFCDDQCRMRYHLALRNKARLQRLPQGPRRVAHWKARKKGAEIGLIDMPIARRSAWEAAQRGWRRPQA